MECTVSVVLPVYDAEATLSATLTSVQAQTLEDFELLIVLNGCTDDSADIATRHARDDRRIRIIELPEAGLVPALNKGLELANAPLVARFDADDLMLPERLNAQMDALAEHTKWVLCTCGVRHDGEPGGMAEHVRWLNLLRTPEEIHAARFIDAPVAHPSVMFRRDAIIAAGGYRDGLFPEDYDLWLRLLEEGPVFGRVDRELVVWRDRPHRLSRTDPRYSPEAFRRLKHQHLLPGLLDGGRRRCRIWGAGPYGKRHAKELWLSGARIEDLIDIDPRKIGGRIPVGGGTAELPVSGPETVGARDGRLILVCVASRGAREEIADRLDRRGHVRGSDYVALQ